MEGKKEELNFETLAIHAGNAPDVITGAIAPPLVRTKTFKQPEFGIEGKWQYARGQNPTREILEKNLSALEGDGDAIVFGSGLAAEAMFFMTLQPGDHVVLCKEVYGGTYRLLEKVFAKFGISASFVDFSKKENIKKSINENTKYIFVELLTNPSLYVNDLLSIREISVETGVPFVVDMTFTPPCSVRAFEYGAETIIHSLSKYISGHNDVMGGSVITKNKEVYEKIKFLQKAVGALLSPDECYRVIQGIKTLSLRWKKSSENALNLAEFLEKQETIKKIYYPGLKSNPQYELAKKQINMGFGSVVSFEVKNVHMDKVKRFVEKLQEDNCIFYGESLAAPETLLAYPIIMSHKALSDEEKNNLGITKWFFRISLGFEDIKDIIKSFEKALGELSDE